MPKIRKIPNQRIVPPMPIPPKERTVYEAIQELYDSLDYLDDSEFTKGVKFGVGLAAKVAKAACN